MSRIEFTGRKIDNAFEKLISLAVACQYQKKPFFPSNFYSVFGVSK